MHLFYVFVTLLLAASDNPVIYIFGITACQLGSEPYPGYEMLIIRKEIPLLLYLKSMLPVAVP